MNDQLSFCLSDEVAPYFTFPEAIGHYCQLIDEKATQGKKYDDLKAFLLLMIDKFYGKKLNDPSDSFNIYRRAYEFAKYY